MTGWRGSRCEIGQDASKSDSLLSMECLTSALAATKSIVVGGGRAGMAVSAVARLSIERLRPHRAPPQSSKSRVLLLDSRAGGWGFVQSGCLSECVGRSEDRKVPRVCHPLGHIAVEVVGSLWTPAMLKGAGRSDRKSILPGPISSLKGCVAALRIKACSIRPAPALGATTGPLPLVGAAEPLRLGRTEALCLLPRDLRSRLLARLIWIFVAVDTVGLENASVFRLLPASAAGRMSEHCATGWNQDHVLGTRRCGGSLSRLITTNESADEHKK